MKNIANADRPKSAGAMLPPRPLRRSGNVAQTACNSDRREGKSRIPTLNQTFADSRILKISKIPSFRIAFLKETVGFLTVPHQVLVTVVDMTRLEAFVPHWHGLPGRPLAERAALARAFVAKAVLNLPTTRMLIERVEADKTLRRLCGWSRPCEVPSESTFSRAFAEFADSELPSRVHEALIRQTHVDRLVGHIARDSTAIEGHEKPERAEKSGPSAPMPTPRKRGRP